MTLSIHVLPLRDGGWIVRKENESREEGHFTTREEALGAGRTMCDALRADLVIHNKDGTVTHE